MLCLIRVVLFGLIFTGMTVVSTVRDVVHVSHARQERSATTTLNVS